MNQLDDLLARIHLEFPQFEIVPKSESGFMKAIDLCLKIISFGQLKIFMTGFTTTIGYTVYTPSGWEPKTAVQKVITLRHEQVHMRQRARMGWLWFSLSYLLLPCPVLWAYFRMKYEMEAYEETIRGLVEYFGPTVLTADRRDIIIAYFTTSAYLWTWPWKSRIEKWYDAFVASLPPK